MPTENDALKKDIQELRESLDKLTKDVSAIGASLADEVKTRAGRTADSVREGARNAAGEIGAKGKQTVDTVENTVRERPLQSVMVAFGVGLLLAQLVRRR